MAPQGHWSIQPNWERREMKLKCLSYDRLDYNHKSAYTNLFFRMLINLWNCTSEEAKRKRQLFLKSRLVLN
jgi:hypothetical protein